MDESENPLSKAMKPNKTKKDAENENIEENRGQMGALLLRKNEGSQILSSGSIVNMSSNLFPESTCFPTGVNIRMEDYYIEFWKSGSSKTKILQLNKIAQPSQCHRSKAGLVLIPVQPPSKKNIFDNRRTLRTVYYDKEEDESPGGDDIHCYIMGSLEDKKDSLTGEPFTLILKKDSRRQLQYELHDVKGSVFNTKNEALISPVFFTQKNLTEWYMIAETVMIINSLDEVQFFHPSCDFKQQVSAKAIANPGSRSQVDASLTDSSVHTPLASSMTATPGETRSSCERYPLVTGYLKKSTFTQHPAIVPEHNISLSGTGNPTHGDDCQQLPKVNFCTFLIEN
ncbi:hypothetical protein OS493_034196 [Desmophyllum pertusum]|uniref:Uncharacterized protein n=1 Tax=Desmophyllum pertusum TaxID=174260 RepID=A0A9X0D0R3_9CNID|nr:hypothetical protein OS493_034196 [Desmophyllum pertusum]